MAKEIKTPVEITQKGTPDSYGNIAYFIKFNDGSSGFFRTPKQDLFVIGQPAECMIEQVQKKDGTGFYSKISRVKKEFGPRGGQDPKEKNRAFSLRYSVDFHIAIINQGGKAETMDVISLAEDFNSWLNGYEKSEPTPAPQEVDELPF